MSTGDHPDRNNIHKTGDIYEPSVTVPPWQNPPPVKNEPRFLYNRRDLLDINVIVKFSDPDLYGKVMSGRTDKAMTTDDILDSLSDLMETARKKKDEDIENARKWAIMVTELEKLYAWYFTFLFGE